MPDMCLEGELIFAGESLVAGIDEAGRGPLAGPVAAAAVILPPDYKHEWLDDSKKLSEARREILYQELTTDSSICWSLSLVGVEEIDEVNILRATHVAMGRAVEALKQIPSFCLIDGLDVPNFPLPSRGVVKGDGISLSIAAASVIAKVSRDRYMRTLGERFPAYGFETHKGYGTKAHLEALEIHGPCEEHRRSFAPIAAFLPPGERDPEVRGS